MQRKTKAGTVETPTRTPAHGGAEKDSLGDTSPAVEEMEDVLVQYLRQRVSFS